MSTEAVAWVLRGGPEGGAVSIPDDDRHRLGLGEHKVRCVLLVLAEYADARGCAWPGVRRLAAEASCHKRDVEQALGVLEASGLIERAGTAGRAIIWRLPMSGDARGSDINDVSGDARKPMSGDMSGLSSGDMSGLSSGDARTYPIQSRSDPSIRQSRDSPSDVAPPDDDSDSTFKAQVRATIGPASDGHVERVVADVLGRAEGTVTDPQAYVLAALRRERSRYVEGALPPPLSVADGKPASEEVMRGAVESMRAGLRRGAGGDP